MPRIRTIKPEFWSDEKIMEISPLARLFFIGTWNFADDNGVLENKPKQLLARIFPGDRINIGKLIEELMIHGLLLAFEVDGQSYLQVINLRKHQVIDRKRKTSLPTPENAAVNGNQLKSVEISVGREGKGKEIHPPTPLKGDEGEGLKHDFQKFWAAYPRKIGERAAFQVFARQCQEGSLPLLAELLLAIERQRTWEEWRREGGRYIPRPAKWLLEGRWQDEPPPGESQGPPGGRTYDEPKCPQCRGHGIRAARPEEMAQAIDGKIRCECSLPRVLTRPNYNEEPKARALATYEKI